MSNDILLFQLMNMTVFLKKKEKNIEIVSILWG